MEPITIIVTALALGAAAGLKATAEQAVKDSYAGLKTLIQRKYARVSLDQLEEVPESRARRAVVEEDLRRVGAEQDEEVLRQAQQVLDAIRSHAPEAAGAVGVNLEDVKAASLTIADIIAAGTGVHVERAEFTGDIEIREVRAGGVGLEPGDSPAGTTGGTGLDDRVRGIKILFLAANPSDTTRLRLDEESRAIDQALRRSEFRDRFDVVQHWAARVSDLQDLLLRHRPDIVHFSGHGSPAGEIIVEDDAGQMHPLSVRAVSRLFAVLKDNIRCVVLNACYSEEQARAVADHIDCVVGMSQAVGDRASISFAAAFYLALGYGRDVDTAFKLGCLQIDLEDLGEQETPQLLATKADPTQVVFVVGGETAPKV